MVRRYQARAGSIRLSRQTLAQRLCRPTAIAGGIDNEEAQVDYGSSPMVRDPNTGRYRRTRLFVLTLGHSRKSVRLLVFRSSAQIWAELHEKAFRRLSGVTSVFASRNHRRSIRLTAHEELGASVK